MKLQILALFLILHCALGQSILKRVLIQNGEARCLDGTPGAYYYEQGLDPSKIVIYFEGGGWCGDKDLSSTLQNCYQRSKTGYGSSTGYPPTLTMTSGILSDSSHNYFRNATRVMLRYCDGSGHQGTRSSPIVYKDKTLYFRGNNITIAQFDDLQRRLNIFTKGKQIIVTGGSAGGLAAFLWADYVRQRATNSYVYAIPDSGVFLDFKTFDTNQNAYANQFQNIFKLSNIQIAPPVPECVRNYPNAPYKCMMAEYMHKYIKTPIFAIQSLYDSWSIPNILNIFCLDGSSLQKCSQQQRSYIQKYQQKTKQVLNQISSREGNGIWGVGCATHGFLHLGRQYSEKYRIPMNSQNSIDSGMANWIEGGNSTNIYLDEEPWPSNKPCSGLDNQKYFLRSF